MPTRTDSRELRARLQRLAAPQGGYFTARQALEAGYSYPAQHYHSQQGAWERVDRAIYRLHGWPLPEHPELIRWALWSRGEGIVSHQSALSVHELGDFMPAVVHLTLPEGTRRKAPGVVVHGAELAEADVESREGFNVTSPERSLLDVAASGVEPDQLGTAVEEAAERGLASTQGLRTRVDSFGPEAALALERALAAE